MIPPIWLALALGGCVKAPPAPRGAGPRPPPADDLVYFVLVDRFYNGDPSNDGEVQPEDPHGFHGGDLAGVLQRLDYLEALGVRSLWLSPVFELQDTPFDGWGAFHGYWVRDLRHVDPRFGTDADLIALGEELDRRGMRLVLDVVYNHTSYDAPLRAEQPGWFHPDRPIVDWDDPVQRVTHSVHGLPDLAQENPEVYAYLRDATARWIEDAGVDGLRVDAVRHLPEEFLRQLSADLHGTYGPGLWMLGEDFQGDPGALAASQRAGGFDTMFDFPLRYALVDTVCGGGDLRALEAVLSLDRLYPDAGALVSFLDNHDLPRVLSACGGDAARVQVLWGLLFSLRGTPSLTWGSELGLEGAHEPDNRQDMPWDRAATPDPVLTAMVRLRREALLPQAPRTLLQAGSEVLEWAQPGRAGLVRVQLDRRGPPATGPGAEALLRVEAPGLWLLIEQGPAQELPAQGAPVLVPVRVEAPPLGAGEELLLVGAAPELGGWDPARGLALTPGAGGVLEGRLPARSGEVLAFKLVLRGPAGVRWEEGPNRYATPGAAPEALVLRWGGP